MFKSKVDSRNIGNRGIIEVRQRHIVILGVGKSIIQGFVFRASPPVKKMALKIGINAPNSNTAKKAAIIMVEIGKFQRRCCWYFMKETGEKWGWSAVIIKTAFWVTLQMHIVEDDESKVFHEPSCFCGQQILITLFGTLFGYIGFLLLKQPAAVIAIDVSNCISSNIFCYILTLLFRLLG